MVFKVLLLACLLQLPRYVNAWSIVTSQPIEPRLMSLEEMIDSQEVFRLNDREMGLTAFKDKKLSSCFVNDYDPYWELAPEDEVYFVESRPCEKVNVTTDFSTLKKKAGPKIARMCRELYIFWLTSRNMAPPPLPGAPVQQHLKPCRVKYDDDFANEQSSSENHLLRSENGPSSTQQDRAESMVNDGAPPMIDNGPPPMLGDGPPPLMGDGPPPMIDNGAPPVMGDSAPPMLGDGAPPMIGDGAPPMSKDDEMGPPPFLQNSHGRRDLDAPSLIKTPPPLNLLAVLTSRTSRVNAEEKRHTIAPIWRKMMNQVKQLNTIAPPLPDMKTPPPPPAFFRKNM